jgi:hypothetical protein
VERARPGGPHDPEVHPRPGPRPGRRRIGTLGIPNDWWPTTGDWDEKNDCIKFVLTMLGVCSRKQQDTHFISIAGFRGLGGLERIAPPTSGPATSRSGTGPAADTIEHAELVYSIDHASQKITTISANTSPAPGVAMTAKNRGVYKKTRDITPSLLAGIRPPYKPATATITSAAPGSGAHSSAPT